MSEMTPGVQEGPARVARSLRVARQWLGLVVTLVLVVVGLGCVLLFAAGNAGAAGGCGGG